MPASTFVQADVDCLVGACLDALKSLQMQPLKWQHRAHRKAKERQKGGKRQDSGQHLNTRVWGRPKQDKLPATLKSAPGGVLDEVDALLVC